ncbi:ABC transporter ATP-binding protein [Bacillus sp. C28GYM-DRY-1]|uniref:ABC transporter ATP-binding protein n=1 Tax=Bacillus sp. C28GYM-DRY-1 TaxID=3062686 RepID=UPI002674623C|nr:ABC transporter ATP-binding protein [Bacillus sp. C28GYM-DRY-1]MDO3662398.1 ABC transporter ATP-binding protein [Bacillus sp. C28GYM-DRY-1]
MSEYSLVLNQVTKRIKHTTIVDSVSFKVKKGEIFGLLGPNGSGKTTIFRMIVQLIKKTEGEISFYGKSDRDFEYFMKNIGVIIEGPDMYPNMTSLQNLKYFSKLRSSSITNEDIYHICAKVGIEHALNKKVKHLSLGMKQRLGLAYALLNHPKLLILDEPMNGLDPKGMIELREILNQLANEGVSIILSSHLLSEMEELCDRVAFIKKGKIIGIEEIKRRDKTSEKKQFSIKVDYPDAAKEIVDKQEDAFFIKQSENNVLEIEAPEGSIPYIIKKLVEQNILIYYISLKALSLEEKYLLMTDHNQEDAV